MSFGRAKFTRAEAASLIFLLINRRRRSQGRNNEGDFCRMEFLCRRNAPDERESRETLLGLLLNLIILLELAQTTFCSESNASVEWVIKSWTSSRSDRLAFIPLAMCRFVTSLRGSWCSDLKYIRDKWNVLMLLYKYKICQWDICMHIYNNASFSCINSVKMKIYQHSLFNYIII